MSDPVEIVTEFLGLVEARDLDSASSYLAEGVQITFPGSRIFSNLQEQVSSSKGRFRAISKVFEHFDVVEGDEQTVVYVFGTLEGVSSEGDQFSGVRFIDRFVLRDGRIVDQKVWNDVAESGVFSPGKVS